MRRTSLPKSNDCIRYSYDVFKRQFAYAKTTLQNILFINDGDYDGNDYYYYCRYY